MLPSCSMYGTLPSIYEVNVGKYSILVASGLGHLRYIYSVPDFPVSRFHPFPIINRAGLSPTKITKSHISVGVACLPVEIFGRIIHIHNRQPHLVGKQKHMVQVGSSMVIWGCSMVCGKTWNGNSSLSLT